MPNRSTLLFLVVLNSLFSCSPATTSEFLEYSTKSDSALYYYKLGWKQIMDQGHYTQSGETWEKSLSFDSEFLLAQCVRARLSTDLEERIELYNDLQSRKNELTGDERLIFDVYLALVDFTNIREQQPDKIAEVLDKVFALAENNLRKLVHKYPEEIYLKAEYIEVLHAQYGAEPTLDSVALLTLDHQKENPFILGYQASMLAELGEFDLALERAELLGSLLNPEFPKSHVVYADVYFAMDSLEKAFSSIEKAYTIDPGNLDASRIRNKVTGLLEVEENH